MSEKPSQEDYDKFERIINKAREVKRKEPKESEGIKVMELNEEDRFMSIAIDPKLYFDPRGFKAKKDFLKSLKKD